MDMRNHATKLMSKFRKDYRLTCLRRKGQTENGRLLLDNMYFQFGRGQRPPKGREKGLQTSTEAT